MNIPPTHNHKYATSSKTTNGTVTMTTGDKGRRHGDNDRIYINIQYVNGQPDIASLPLAPGTGKEYHPEYVNIPMEKTGTGMRPDVEQKIGNGTAGQSQSHPVLENVDTGPPPIPVKSTRSSSHVPMFHAKRPHNDLPPRSVTECTQCSDLLEWLSLWELGVSGLTRQYSQILAQLNHARDAATIIECKMRENWEKRVEGEREGEGERGGGGGETQIKNKRHSGVLEPIEEELVQPLSTSTNTLADQMYPKRDEFIAMDTTGLTPPQLPGDYEHQFAELTSRLGRAIDLCQQLAASSFKTQTSGLLKATKNMKKNVKRQESTPLSLTPGIPRKEKLLLSSWRPLVSTNVVANDNRLSCSGSGKAKSKKILTRMETEPVLSVSSEVDDEGEKTSEERVKEKVSELRVKVKESKQHSTSKATTKQSSKTGLSRSKSRYVPNKEKPSKSSQAGDLAGDKELQAVHSHMTSFNTAKKEGGGQGLEGSSGGTKGDRRSSGDDEEDYMILSHSSTFSDTDVKQVMTKIAVLEDERLKLLETVDQMQNDNQRVRLSLQETLGDLENKDLQLMLAMQDLTLATDEIRRVAGLRTQLETMEEERVNTLDKLSSLEDESAAVKVSLIQLLQEKSATNKTLALENWRLRQTVRQGDSLSRTNSRSSATQEPTLNYLKEDDLSNYVHKQGFLVKQGRRVKNWKKRLFVLDSTGLSYFKTEHPIHKVSLSDIKKIQVAHNHAALSHMFEVHTPERVFFLSAPSEDEMQSWIGMLQTLKQYSRHKTPPMTTGYPPGPPNKPGEPISSLTSNEGTIDAVLHEVAMENGDVVTAGKAWRSTTLPMTTGTAIRSQVDQVGMAPNTVATALLTEMLRKEVEHLPTLNGVDLHQEPHGSRPRSQAFTMTKELSLDEAIPDTSRPMSVINPQTMSEWEHDQTTIAEESPNRVLSRSHPGNTTQQLTVVFDT